MRRAWPLQDVPLLLHLLRQRKVKVICFLFHLVGGPVLPPVGQHALPSSQIMMALTDEKGGQGGLLLY